jgi:uncharacterized protein YhbP (UPF0306 family)
VSDDGLRARVLDHLAARSVATLSTLGPEGPWAAAVFYVNRGFTLYFLSSPRSRHATDLARDPRVAAAIHEDQPEWRLIRGVQLSGTAAGIDGDELVEAQRLYGAKFPLIAGPPPPVAAALAKVRWYRLVAERLFFVDNATGFGQRAELPLQKNS